MRVFSSIPKARVLSIAVISMVSATVMASELFDVKEEQYNPDGLSVTIAAEKVKGAGNPVNTDDKHNYGWVLARNNTPPLGPSADLTLKFKGDSLNVTEVGFDRLMGATQCGGGSPRFNVETATEVLFLECDQPSGPIVEGSYTVTTTRTDFGNGWERIRFQISPAASAVFLQVMSDSGPGAALIDNINVNGVLVGK
jgi:hypothetical protein